MATEKYIAFVILTVFVGIAAAQNTVTRQKIAVDYDYVQIKTTLGVSSSWKNEIHGLLHLLEV